MLAVLLCFNDGDILSESIEALLESGHHVLVWDHGSTDNTSSVIQRYSKELLSSYFLPRSLEFSNLYPTVSRTIIENYCSKYDWVSWPDADEFLEGPDRSKPYVDFVYDVFQQGYTSLRFDNFIYWYTEQDDTSLTSSVGRVRYYCVFPDCAPRIRAWRASVTNERHYNHNTPPGREYPIRFRLRHYPARSKSQFEKRILVNRAGLPRNGDNHHYLALARNLNKSNLRTSQLHFDNGVDDLHESITFDWRVLYR
ncbi:MAG TPA: glycosyltransferase family 2 protein [Planktothrix sp.]|jgi:glycosyltransferase involved in cell wall biosynthesis